MKIKDIINTEDLLNEAILSTEFTIGFELEGICTLPEDEDEDGDYEEFYLPDYHDSDNPQGGARVLTDYIERTLKKYGGQIQSDGSLNSDNRGGWEFEYASPILPFNPTTINNMKKLLNRLDQFDVYTNNSCGFHVHISHKGITKQTAAWVICCMAWDEELFKNITYLNDIEFFNDEYAKTDFLERIKEHLTNKNWDRLNTNINNEKYKVVRIHNYGTLEWRGPRNFLSKTDTISQFIKRLYEVVLTIGKISDAKEWKGLNRKEVEEHIKVNFSFDSEEERKKEKKKTSLIQAVIKNPLIVLGLRPSDFETLKGDGLQRIIDTLSEDKLKLFMQAVDKSTPFKKSIVEKQLFENFSTFCSIMLMVANKEIKYTPSKKTLEEAIASLFGRGREMLAGSGVDPKAVVYIISVLGYVPPTLMKEFENNLDKKKYTKVMLQIANELPSISFELYKMIAKSNYIEILRSVPNLPKKIQEILIRRSPYFIQYINNPDSALVKRLSTKIPNIEDYVMGVL